MSGTVRIVEVRAFLDLECLNDLEVSPEVDDLRAALAALQEEPR